MSLTKRFLESQPEFQIGYDFATLEAAVKDVRSAAATLDRIENLHELSFTDLDAISRVLHLAIERLEYLREHNEEPVF